MNTESKDRLQNSGNIPGLSTIGGSSGGSSSLYKSEFIKERLNE